MAGMGRGRDALYVHPLHLHLLLVFHPPVLEPDLDLSLRQAQHGRHLNPSEQRTGQLHVRFSIVTILISETQSLIE